MADGGRKLRPRGQTRLVQQRFELTLFGCLGCCSCKGHCTLRDLLCKRVNSITLMPRRAAITSSCKRAAAPGTRLCRGVEVIRASCEAACSEVPATLTQTGRITGGVSAVQLDTLAARQHLYEWRVWIS